MRRWLLILILIVLSACRAGSTTETPTVSSPTALPPTRSAVVTPTDLTSTLPPTRSAVIASAVLTSTLRQMQLDRYIGIQPSHQEAIAQSNWTIYHYDQASCQCILGDEYALLARPGTESDKTVFWMDGGGACWPGKETCTTEIDPSREAAEYGLASPDSRNPLRDWNFVYVPYCDGSIHMGDSEADYDGNGQVDHHHQGLRTTSAAVTLMKKLFPQSKKILIAGCSAGGYGTLLATPVIRLQYPDAQLYVMNAGGPGLYNPDRSDNYDLIMKTWKLEPHLPIDCPECREQLINLYPWLLARDPKVKIGLFSSYQDSVIGHDFLGMTPQAFQNLLMSTTDQIHAEFPDTFKRYFVKGTEHCVSDYFHSVDGISVRDWIEDLVTDSPEWQDVLE